MISEMMVEHMSQALRNVVDEEVAKLEGQLSKTSCQLLAIDESLEPTAGEESLLT